MHTWKFLSTLSLRRATSNEGGEDTNNSNFYPRSPCGERQLTAYQSGRLRDFYPRSPCGERPPRVFRHCTTYLFLSTLSLRRATETSPYKVWETQISIHALLAESDSSMDDLDPSTTHFYPRSPCGERLFANFDGFYWWVISIHALLAESDRKSQCSGTGICISIHALLAESDLVSQ